MENAATTIQGQSMHGAMKSLTPGETVSFPIAKVQTVRTMASNINTSRQCLSLSTKTDRIGGLIYVTRNI